MLNKNPDSFNELYYAPWPIHGLEAVTHCPVCRNSSRETLHSDLTDNAFRVAPGKWTLWECGVCRSAYLDPRPTSETIHLAYETYYTHQEGCRKVEYTMLSPLRKLRRRLLNGYTNWRFGTRAEPASALGALVIPLLPNLRARLDSEFRHLPKPPIGGGNLLEIGFGSGAFLSRARQCGWGVQGVDPDANVVSAARELGFDVRQGGVELFSSVAEKFDVIVMRHVIEHVYQPTQVLESCYLLLKPGGVLYIETPNLNSLGHAYFGRHWRGLEPPRHLVLFRPDSLHRALQQVGFSRVEWKPQANPVRSISLASSAISQDQPIDEVVQLSQQAQRFVRNATRIQSRQRDQREYITFMAHKNS